MTTKDNLQEAFAGESQANRRYLAFAKQAEKDGYPQIAKLFRGVAEAETIHAHAHLKAMGGINSTAENLKEAIDGEHFEFTEMYPPYLKTAEEECDRKAAMSFAYALEVEKIHHDLYSKALAALEAGGDLPEGGVHICPVCGHTVFGDVEENCPICAAKKEKYIEV